MRLARFRRSLSLSDSSRDARRVERRGRIAAVGLSIVLIAGAASTLVTGIAYPNYWGGSIFAPVALIIGVATLLLALFPKRASRFVSRLSDGKPFPGSSEEWRKW